VYPALLPLMRTPRLLVVDKTDAPADLNGLLLFAERRNLVSARVPSHFSWLLPYNDLLFYVISILLLFHKFSKSTLKAPLRWRRSTERSRSVCNIIIYIYICVYGGGGGGG